MRVKAGDFEINEAIKLDDLDTLEAVQKSLIYPLENLHFPKYELNEKEKAIISNGGSIKADVENSLVCLTFQGVLCAVARATEGVLKCEKVFL